MEIINSFFSNIKDKLTNPFFGTLSILLIFSYWELWYTIFNFDPNQTLEFKILWIKNYIGNNITFSKLSYKVLYAVILMFLGYVVIIGTRSMVLWIEFNLMPKITGKIVNKNVVRKSEYDEAIKEREEYFDQYEEQRKNVRIFSKTIDEQTEQIKLKDENALSQSKQIGELSFKLNSCKDKLTNIEADNEELNRKKKELNDSLADIEKKYQIKLKKIEMYNHLFFGEESLIFFDSINKFPPEVIAKVKELKKDNSWDSFKTLGDFFQNGGSMGGQTLTYMIEKGLAFDRGSQEDFTPVGSIIWNYRKLFDDYHEIF